MGLDASWLSLLLGAGGEASSVRGANQKAGAEKNANARYQASLAHYLAQQHGENQLLTGQLDQLGNQRRAALTGTLGSMASNDRYAAGDRANYLGQALGRSAASGATSQLPLGANYTTIGAGTTASDTLHTGRGTESRLADALAYSGANRGNQALQMYDENAMNNLGTRYTTLGRQAGEAQARAAMQQAEIDRQWQLFSNQHGVQQQNAANAGNNAQMLGQALMLGGTYAGSISANRPAQQQGIAYQPDGNSSNYATGTVGGDTYFR